MKPAGRISHCAGCKSNIKDNKHVSCTSINCKNVFHHLCVNYKSTEPNETWICPDCRSTIKRVGDNSATPVRHQENVTIRKQRNTSPTTGSISELTQEICLLRQEVSSMKIELKTVVSTLSKFEERLDDMSTKISTQESRITALENQAAGMVDLKIQFKHLQEKFNNQSQGMLRKDVEIQGIAETASEDANCIISLLASAAGIRLDETEIDFANRVGPARPNSSRPRPLVVRFTRRATRDKFFRATKARHLSTKDANIKGPETNVYVNERLTKENRQLFRTCRTEFKNAGFKYCWTKDGTIFVKRREGKSEEAYTIKTHEDIQKIQKLPQKGEAEQQLLPC